MSFFDSEVVRSEMAEISEMQEEIYHNVYKFFMMNKEEKLQHVNLLQKLLEKQQILYTRISLSDDPEAKEMKKRVIESAVMMGIPEKSDITMIFSNMTRLIDTMKEAIDKE